MTVEKLKKLLENIAGHVKVKLLVEDRSHGGGGDDRVDVEGIELVPDDRERDWNCLVIRGKEF